VLKHSKSYDIPTLLALRNSHISFTSILKKLLKTKEEKNVLHKAKKS